MKTCAYLSSYLAEFWEWEKFQIYSEYQNTHFVFIIVLTENSAVYNNVEKYCSQTGHRWQYMTAPALCVLDS